EGEVALDAVVDVVDAGGDGVPLAGVVVDLQSRAVAHGVEAAGEDAVVEIGGQVLGAAGVEPEQGVFAGIQPEPCAVDFLGGLGLVLKVAVELGLVVGLEVMKVDLAGTEPEAGARAAGGVLVAVVVGFDGEAAGHAGLAATGVEAVGLSTAQGEVEPGVVAAAGDAERAAAGAIAAAAEREARRQFAATAAGEDLHHAADGLGAVQVRARSAHDL